MNIWNWFKKKEPKGRPKDGERFEDYIDRQGFKNFTGYELSRYFYRWRGNVQNAYPPRALWESFLPTLNDVRMSPMGRFATPLLI